MRGVTRDLAKLLAGGATLGPPVRMPVMPPALDADEASFQARVVELAVQNGWLVYHTYDSRRSNPGFPDLVAVREVVLWIELKSRTGRLSAEQEQWKTALLSIGERWFCWRPIDWPQIVSTFIQRYTNHER